MLIINDLNKSYGGKEILSKINIKFHHGNIYGIMGHNGAGKSTFFRCICRLEKYKGNIVDENFTNLKNNIAYLSTNPYFYPKLTGKEYLMFFRRISKTSNDIDIAEWNKLFKLPLEEYVEEYSTGMKKKIAFFALLLQNKQILILDEPFNGLDIDAVIIFKQIILKLKEKHCLILIASHTIESLTDISDKIYFLNNGEFEKEYTKETYSNIVSDLSENLEKEISKIKF